MHELVWSAHELVFSGLSCAWPTLDMPFWLDVGDIYLSLSLSIQHTAGVSLIRLANLPEIH